ncbi:MAG TPA: hypothetical protein DC031_01285 [Sulfitobacter sp.]|uniref:hypothetical protein n=1 Tax=Sulfitobacter TaxID=60136 RepID=UPI000C6800A5|nr:hypothetical protein [Sulfitobacter sp.]HBB81920.1 hypothetical protein [Sulfitobacter sp.]
MAREAHFAQRVQNYELAVLVSFAFHDPKKMPDPPEAEPREKEAPRDVDHARVRGFFMGLAMGNGGE